EVDHPDKDRLIVSTFHSYSLRMLRELSAVSSYSYPDFKLYDPDNVISVLKGIAQKMCYQYTKRDNENYINIKTVANQISYFKNELVDAETLISGKPNNRYQKWDQIKLLIKNIDEDEFEIFKSIYANYESEMKGN